MTTTQPITQAGTINNSAVHADARDFAFDASGRLLLSNDTGIYALTSPLSSPTGCLDEPQRQPFGARRLPQVAYDLVSHRLLVAAQDAGAGYQKAPLLPTLSLFNAGDGLVAAINDRTYAASGKSILYSSSQGLAGLLRTEVNAQGAFLNKAVLLRDLAATNTLNGTSSPAISPRRITRHPTALLQPVRAQPPGSHEDRDRHQLRLRDDRRTGQQRHQPRFPDQRRQQHEARAGSRRWPTAPPTMSMPCWSA